MALGTTGAAIAGGLASGAASAGIGALASGGGGGGGGGGGTPIGLISPSFHAGFYDRGQGHRFMDINRGPAMEQTLARLRGLTDEQSGELTDLLGLVQPGFSQMREARLGAIENARNRSVSNLSENLQRRRVLGSSFAQDALARADAEFGQVAAEAEAQSFLEEMDMTSRLLEQRFQTNLEAVTTEINQSNFETEIAARLSGAASSAMTANNQINAQLAMSRAQLASQGAAGMGRFFQPGVDAIGDAVSQWAQGGGQLSAGPALQTSDFIGAFNPANAGFL